MRGNRWKNSDFRVAPMENSTDTLISYVLGVLGAVFIVISIVKSVISKGNVERIYGALMVSAALMSITGTIFSIIGYRSEEGNVTGKRIAIYINVGVLILSVIFFLTGR